MRRFICLLLSICFCLTALPAFALEENPVLDEDLGKIFKNFKTVGAVLVVAKGDEIIYQRNYGYSYLLKKVRTDEKTHFRVASVTKMLSAIRVMQLVEEGLLDLDEDISTYLGYTVRNPYYPKSRVTLRNLMSHTSSLSVGGGYSTKRNPLRKLISTDRKQLGNFHDEAPGTEYRYSNFGAGIMGSLMEAVTGENLNDTVYEHVFKPLDIDAAYHPALLKDTESVSYIYARGGTKLMSSRKAVLEEDWDPSVNPEMHYRLTVGAIWITGRDLCRIGMLLRNGGELDGVRLLEEETVQAMMASQEGKGNVTIDSPYGLCINRIDNLLEDRMIYGHQGMSGDICSNLYWDPESSLVFALITNGCNNTMDDRICTISRRLFERIWEEYGE